MNGRLYDPVLHRFLQPDNYVQDPFNTQNFNRYGYVLNNPLKYTDPSGEIWHLVIGAVIGGIVNWATNGAKFNAEGLAYFGIGAVAGALSAGIGSGVSSVLAGGTFGAGFLSSSAITASSSGFFGGFVSGFAGGFSGGLVGGTGNAWMKGASFGEGLGIGANSGLVSGIIGGGINGFSSHIRYRKIMRPFKTMMEKNNLSVNDALPINDEFLKQAQEVWFPDAPMDNVNLFTTEKLSNIAKRYFSEGAEGLTLPLVKKGGLIVTGNSNVYISPSAFSSARNLYRVIGHELVHVSQIKALAGQTLSLVDGLRDIMEYHAHNYQSIMGVPSIGSSYTPAMIKEMISSEWFSRLSHYSFPWTSNINYRYPF